jgi:hypothetical protein
LWRATIARRRIAVRTEALVDEEVVAKPSVPKSYQIGEAIWLSFVLSSSATHEQVNVGERTAALHLHMSIAGQYDAAQDVLADGWIHRQWRRSAHGRRGSPPQCSS